jgi:hypothetical protein
VTENCNEDLFFPNFKNKTLNPSIACVANAKEYVSSISKLWYNTKPCNYTGKPKIPNVYTNHSRKHTQQINEASICKLESSLMWRPSTRAQTIAQRIPLNLNQKLKKVEARSLHTHRADLGQPSIQRRAQATRKPTPSTSVVKS